MKKFLSLVLALVMTMSLVTVSAGAKDFTDDSEITYKEAVDVISALGVVDGYSGGDFRPDDVLTRGAAAKIICNLILGPTTASALSAGTAPFKDVPVTNTFAGYITYCSQQGIISGYADGTFRPTGTLSGNAFMKMLLGALGYDSSIEGYTGPNWQVSVIKQASGIGLDDGNDEFVGSKAVTRQEAALYAYNMLNATMVEYDQKNTIVVGDIEINTTSTRKDVENNDKTETIANDDKMQFAERYFDDLKKQPGDSDEFERPATTWKLKSETIGTYADEADLTYTAAVELGDIYKDLDLSSSLKASEVDIYRNGVADKDDGKLGIVKSDSTEIGGNGVLTEVFYNDDDETAVITMIDTYLGEVTSTHKASGNRDAYISISPKADGVGVGGNFDTEESFDVDDLVLYTYSNKSGDKGIQTVVNTSETVTGTLQSYTAGKSVKVADTTYKGTAAYKEQIASLDNAVDQEVTVYLDQYGYVVYVDTDAISGNYAVVLKQSRGVEDEVKLLFADGTTKTVVVSSGYDTVSLKDIVSYTKNSSGEYKLTLLAQDANSATGNGTTKLIENGESDLSDTAFSSANKGTPNATTAKYANGKTTFLIATPSTNGTEYRAYEGIKNVPDVVVSNSKTIEVATYVEKGSSAARVVYIDASQDATVSGSSDDIVFLKGSNTGASYDSKLGTYYEYDAIINGEFTKIKTADQFTKDQTGLYNILSYDKNGVATNVNKDGNVKAGIGTVRVKNDVVGLASSYYTYTKDCQVFHIDEDGDIDETVYTVSNIATDDNDKVWFVTDSGDVTAIVYQDVPDDNNTYYTVTFTGFSGNTYIQNVNGENISDVQKVIEGKDFQFKLAPVAGKSVASVKVGSETLTPDSNGIYTVSNVKKDIQIDLTFAETVTLTFKSNDTTQAYIVVNGADKVLVSDTANHSVTVAKGSSVTLEIIPASGKTVSGVAATGNFVSGADNNYTIVANAAGDVVITMA